MSRRSGETETDAAVEALVKRLAGSRHLSLADRAELREEAERRANIDADTLLQHGAGDTSYHAAFVAVLDDLDLADASESALRSEVEGLRATVERVREVRDGFRLRAKTKAQNSGRFGFRLAGMAEAYELAAGQLDEAIAPHDEVRRAPPPPEHEWTADLDGIRQRGEALKARREEGGTAHEPDDDSGDFCRREGCHAVRGCPSWSLSCPTSAEAVDRADDLYETKDPEVIRGIAQRAFERGKAAEIARLTRERDEARATVERVRKVAARLHAQAEADEASGDREGISAIARQVHYDSALALATAADLLDAALSSGALAGASEPSKADGEGR